MKGFKYMSDENRVEETPQPQYEHYLFQEEARGEEFPPEKPRRKKKSFGKSLIRTAALAVVFGLVSGTVFTGVQMAGKRFLSTGKNDRNVRIGTAESVTDMLAGAASERKPAGKGTVAEVAQSTMPTVVAITSVSIQEFPSFLDTEPISTKAQEAAPELL